jgi:hypothetical protein
LEGGFHSSGGRGDRTVARHVRFGPSGTVRDVQRAFAAAETLYHNFGCGRLRRRFYEGKAVLSNRRGHGAV